MKCVTLKKFVFSNVERVFFSDLVLKSVTLR